MTTDPLQAHPGGDPNPGGRGGPSPDRPPHRAPRWVKALVVAAAIALLILLGGILFSGGQHGPGRHDSSGREGNHDSQRGATW